MSKGSFLGCITTPKQGQAIPSGSKYICDNGRFGKGWPGLESWLNWLSQTWSNAPLELCKFFTAPDEVGDSETTLSMWREVRGLLPTCAPVAFVAQKWMRTRLDSVGRI